MMNIHRVQRSWLLLAYWIFALMLPFALMGVSAFAQASGSCWLSGPALNFGSVSGKGKTSYTNWQVTCNQYGHTKTVNVALCPYATVGGLSLSNNRRQMVSYGATHSYLTYDLFYDPALTQRIDTQANLSTLKCTYKTFTVNENEKVFDLPIYGHVYAGQNVRAASYDNNNNTQVTLLYAFSQDKQPSTEEVLASQSSNQSNSLSVTTNYENSCNLISASDLNFGQMNDLSRAVTSSTTVALSCPLNTSWKVNLDQGMNYDGVTRRMRKGTDYIAYELYRDAQYNQLWNNSGASQGTGNNGTQTISIYGKAGPSSTAVPAGEYQDTITVILTY
jgi:spore coat protein U-like protein